MALSSPQAAAAKAYGGYGSVFVTDTATYTGEYYAIEAISDCVFTTLVSTNMDNASAWASIPVTLTEGRVLNANFTTVKLASGRAILYKH